MLRNTKKERNFARKQRSQNEQKSANQGTKFTSIMQRFHEAQ